ncbi:MAG: DNA polymerase IV [Ruminococcaceae bacterium]|nr:DNA polymerase IV [Oscillospiraceae bacterium]
MDRTVLHSDLNNFYASVECFLNPALTGHPVAVAGNPEMRHGIVLAKNYEAKRCGVQTGEALWQAKQKCPDIIFVPPHYDKYIEYSDAVRSIYKEYTDMVEPFGLDECWLDVTGSGKLFGSGICIADEIRKRVKRELGVTVSVGVSYNKIFAKLGSDMKKPDATTVIDREHFREKIWHLPAADLLYIGHSTAQKLSRYGINTIGDLAGADRKFLSYLLGKNGLMLHSFANGLDNSPVRLFGADPPEKSISCGNTASRDLISDDDIKIMLITLSEKVSERLRSKGFLCKTVQLCVRTYDLASYVRRTKLTYPCRTAREIYEAAYFLYKSNHPKNIPSRSVTVGACDLISDDGEQFSFDPDIARIQRRESLEAARDLLCQKFGNGIITRGLLMTDESLCTVNLKNTPGILPGRMEMG